MELRNIVFELNEWVKNDCVSTGSTICDVCPYVVYDEDGTRKCDKEMYELCQSGELYEDGE